MAMGSTPRSTFALTTKGSTEEGEHHVFGRCNGVEATGLGAWFTVEGTGGLMASSTCWPGTAFDTKVSVYGGANCTVMSCVTANDDGSTSRSSCPTNSLASRATWQSKLGAQYYLYVHGFASHVGNFELSVETLNDKCSYAAPLAIGDRLVASTAQAGIPFAGNVDRCQKDGNVLGVDRGLWWAVLGTGKRLEISTCDEATEVKTKLFVFESSCEDTGNCIGDESSVNDCVTYQWDSQPLVQYYILVTSFASRGKFGLALREIE